MKSSRSRYLIVLRIQAKGHNYMALVSVSWLTKAPRYLLTLLTITSSCSWSLTSIGSIDLVDRRNITTFNSAARSYQQSITCLLRTIWIQKPSLSVMNIYSPGHLIANTEFSHLAFPDNYNRLFIPRQKTKDNNGLKTLNSKAVGRLLAAGGIYNGNIEGFRKQQTSWEEMHLLVTIKLWITRVTHRWCFNSCWSCSGKNEIPWFGIIWAFRSQRSSIRKTI